MMQSKGDDFFSAKCIYCGSDKAKKRFLGIPRVFGISPVTIGILCLVGGTAAVLHGLVSAKSLSSEGPHNWLIEIIVGIIIVIIAIFGLIFKTHMCLACGKNFNWPPPYRQLKITCPNCGTPLRGADIDMIGDIAICDKCKSEFEINNER